MRIDEGSMGDMLFLKPTDNHYPKGGNLYSNRKLMKDKRRSIYASVEKSGKTDRYDTQNAGSKSYNMILPNINTKIGGESVRSL